MFISAISAYLRFVGDMTGFGTLKKPEIYIGNPNFRVKKGNTIYRL